MKTAAVHVYLWLISWEWSGGDNPGWIPIAKIRAECSRTVPRRRRLPIGKLFSLWLKPADTLVSLKVIRPP